MAKTLKHDLYLAFQEAEGEKETFLQERGIRVYNEDGNVWSVFDKTKTLIGHAVVHPNGEEVILFSPTPLTEETIAEWRRLEDAFEDASIAYGDAQR